MWVSKRVPALCVAGVAALAMTACGSSDKKDSSSKSSNKDSTGNSNITASAADKAKALGQKAAANFGGTVTLPATKTIGLVNVTGESEAAQRIQKGAEEAVAALGWTIKTVDAQGDPAKSQAGISGFVTQKVDAILDLANPTQAIKQGLDAAKAAGIPVIDIGGVADPSPNIQSQFGVDELEFTSVLDKYMLAHVKAPAEIMTFTFPLLLSERLRDQQLKKDLAGTQVKIVANHQIDFSAAVADTQKTVRAVLGGHPKLAAFWSDTDTTYPPTGNVLKQQGKCASVQSYSFYDDLPNLDQIRKGCGTAVVTSPVDSDGWAAMDALAEFFARKQSLADLPKDWSAVDSKYGVQIRNGDAITMVDKSSVPAVGKYVTPKTDFVSFFKAKWAKEFGVGK